MRKARRVDGPWSTGWEGLFQGRLRLGRHGTSPRNYRVVLAVRGVNDVADGKDQASAVTADGPEMSAVNPHSDGGLADPGDTGGEPGRHELVEVLVADKRPCAGRPSGYGIAGSPRVSSAVEVLSSSVVNWG